MTTEADAAVSCQEVENGLILNENYINEQIQKRREETYKRLWVDLIPSTEFKDGEGLIMKKEIFHGDIPDQAEDKWTQVEHFSTEQGEEFNPCVYPEEMTRWGFQEKNWTLYMYGWRTPDICLQQLRRQWQFRQSMDLIYDHLAQITLGDIEMFNRDQYWKYHSTIYLAVPNMFTTGTTGGIPNPVPFIQTMQPLRQGHLDLLYSRLFRDNYGYGLGMTNGLPDFGLVTSPETSDQLVHHDPKVLTDFRESSIVDTLLAGYGVERTYRHYMHLHDPHAPRWKLDGAGSVTRVYPWLRQATSYGESTELNPEYVDPDIARFELSIVLFRPGSVLSMGKVPPMTNAGGQTEFDPNTYFADWKWFNIQDNCNNKWRDVGHYASRAFQAPEPGPITGYGILHLRCDAVINICPDGEFLGVGANPIGLPADCENGPGADELTVLLDTVLTRIDGTALQVGDAVLITYLDATTQTGTVSDLSSAPEYTFQYDAAAPADCADGTGLASVEVTV